METQSYFYGRRKKFHVKKGLKGKQGVLSKKEIQLNLGNIFCIFIFDELYLFD